MTRDQVSCWVRNNLTWEGDAAVRNAITAVRDAFPSDLTAPCDATLRRRTAAATEVMIELEILRQQVRRGL